MVLDYLSNPSAEAWKQYEAKYLIVLRRRFKHRRGEFDKLAALAMREDVYIGCSCPTTVNPDPLRCHTVLALHFMKVEYPELTVEFPLPK